MWKWAPKEFQIVESTNSNQSPEERRRSMLDRFALVAAKLGWEKVEPRMQDISYGNPMFSFVWRADPDHALFKQKIDEYIKCPPPPEPTPDPSNRRVDLPDSQGRLRVLPPRYLSPYTFTVGIPEGMMRKKLDILKLTAQFVARYGCEFRNALWDRVCTQSEFHFLKKSDKRDRMCRLFSELCVAYMHVIKSCTLEPRKSDTTPMEAVVEGFLAAFSSLKEKQEMEKDELVAKRYTDRSDFIISDHCFVGTESTPLPPMAMMEPPLMLSESFPLPPPKRQKCEVSDLVPEDKFLSQHPGPSKIIMVRDTTWEVTGMTVQSLSENVASLKEKIAGKMGIPANQLKLLGKVGYLKDDLSLAYYNLGAGDVLRLFEK